MTSNKKTPAIRRTRLPRRCDYTKTFLKDWLRLSHSGRYNLGRLKQAMILLVANDGPLPSNWLDHPLTGNWRDHRECHLGGDFLLIYKLSGSEQCQDILFVRTGTHAELFG